MRAFRVSTPGQVSTATLPSVIRGGYNNNKNNNNNINNINNINNNKNNKNNKSNSCLHSDTGIHEGA